MVDGLLGNRYFDLAETLGAALLGIAWTESAGLVDRGLDQARHEVRASLASSRCDDLSLNSLSSALDPGHSWYRLCAAADAVIGCDALLRPSCALSDDASPYGGFEGPASSSRVRSREGHRNRERPIVPPFFLRRQGHALRTRLMICVGPWSVEHLLDDS